MYHRLNIGVGLGNFGVKVQNSSIEAQKSPHETFLQY